MLKLGDEEKVFVVTLEADSRLAKGSFRDAAPIPDSAGRRSDPPRQDNPAVVAKVGPPRRRSDGGGRMRDDPSAVVGAALKLRPAAATRRRRRAGMVDVFFGRIFWSQSGSVSWYQCIGGYSAPATSQPWKE